MFRIFIRNFFASGLIWVILLLPAPDFRVAAQTCQLEKQMQQMGLQEIKEEMPDVLVDLRYSGTNNFLKKDMYACLEKAFARPELIRMLKAAEAHLRKNNPGLRLLIFDAARPLSCQRALWNALNMPESSKHIYVADPRKGSIHNYGCAIDLSLANENGKELDMGTAFDFFGELAQPRCELRMLKAGKLSKAQYQNRLKLRQCMTKAGFTITSSEWWHFNACSRRKAAARWPIIP